MRRGLWQNTASEMAVVTNSPTVRMFDPSTMSCVGSPSGHSAVVLCVDAALASDGTALIITGAKDHARAIVGRRLAFVRRRR